MVYLRMTPLGLWGGSHDTTTLLGEEGTALMPAGGPGTAGKKQEHQEGGHDYTIRGGSRCACVCVPSKRWVLLIKVSGLVCRLPVLSHTKPLREDLEEFPLGGRQ